MTIYFLSRNNLYYGSMFNENYVLQSSYVFFSWSGSHYQSCILGQDIVTPIHAFHYIEISTVFFFSKYSLLIIQTYPSKITLIIMSKTTFYPQELPQITFTLESYNSMRQPNTTLDFCVLNFSFPPKSQFTNKTKLTTIII